MLVRRFVFAMGAGCALALATGAQAQDTDTRGDDDAGTQAPWGPPPLADASRLLADGVHLRASLIDQYATNPTGGVKQGRTDVGQFNIGADLDLDKLFGIRGGSFHFTVYRDYGTSLNHDVTGTFTKQQYIYKNEFPRVHLGLFAYEQKLLDDRLDIMVGRLGTTTYYGHLSTNCRFVSANLCGEPRILVSEAGFSLLPSATWGVNVKYRPTPHSYLETGVFEVNPTTSASNGLDFSIAEASGFTVPVEWGWVNADPDATRYPFELKAGGFVSTPPLSDPYYNKAGQSRALYGGSARVINSNRDGVYLMGDRVIWRPDPDGARSLGVFGGIVQQLEQHEIMRQQVYAGLVWNAPFRRRTRDSWSFSVSQFELTPNERDYLRDARIKAGGSGSNNAHQYAYETTYTWYLARGVELMPSIQYIVHPDNSSLPNTPVLPKNLLVYAIGIRVDLGYFLGFGKGAPGD